MVSCFLTTTFFNSVSVYPNCVLVIVLSFLPLLQILILLLMPRGKCIKQSINKENQILKTLTDLAIVTG